MIRLVLLLLFLCSMASGQMLSPEQTEEAWEEMAHAGDPAAQIIMAARYSQKADGTTDRVRAYRWLEKAAKGGSAVGQRELGVATQRGWGTKADPEKGFKLLMQASLAGDAQAQAHLARAYLQGLGTEASESQAAEWAEKAAAQSHPAGLYLHASFLKKTDKLDPRLIRGLMYRAAMRGYAPAQRAYAQMCALGDGGYTDTSEAYAWAVIASTHDRRSDLQHSIGAKLSTKERNTALNRVWELQEQIRLLKNPGGEK